MNNDLDRITMESKNGLLLHETPFPLSDNDISDFQTEISMEIIKLVRKQLQNAQIEGLITAQTRDRLVHRYVTDLKQLEHSIKQKALQERLQKLEKMQEQLVQAYHDNLSQLHTEIQQFRSVSTPNKSNVPRNDAYIPQTSIASKPKQVRLPRPRARRSLRNRFKILQQINIPSFSKYLLSTIIICVLTAIGIRYGMTLFMAAGSLLIGGTLLVRFIKR
ncbi:MAG: hypothetical protein NWE83_04270 [Candidatus Bathyarchaeota archaeon]|nr:hypothetical protein [Candidatus Bathyarchaeota archaeon]